MDDIRSLRKEGYSVKAIARQTGRSRNTVRRVLQFWNQRRLTGTGMKRIARMSRGVERRA
jgi:IS30 family transposase